MGGRTIVSGEVFGAADSTLASSTKSTNAATRTTAEKTAKAKYQNDVNTAGNVYAAGSFAAWTGYVTTSLAAGATYEAAMKAASDTYLDTVVSAGITFDKDYCWLTGNYYDAMNTINGGGTLPSSQGTGSVDVEVCFVAGTPVLMADDTTKAIEKIEVGDKVYARPHDNPAEPLQKCRVVRVYKNAPSVTWKLTFNGGLTVQATPEHPFYVQNKGWVTAQDLTLGDIFVALNDKPQTLEGKEFISNAVPVYNIEVEGCHTYFVGESDTKAVLVHNKCSTCGSWQIWDTCGCKPMGKGPVYEGAKKRDQLFRELTGENYRPFADNTPEMAVGFAQAMPVTAQIIDFSTLVSGATSGGDKVLAATNLMLSFTTLLAGSTARVSNYSDTFQAAKPVRQVARNVEKVAHVAEAPVSQSTRPVSNYAKAAAQQKSPMNVVNKVPGGTTCFTAGTQIVVGMEYDEDDNFVQYVTANIEDIQVGDWVYSYNTLTGTLELSEVTATFAKTSGHLNYLTIVDESGNEQTIETTDVHPFWVVTDESDIFRAAREFADGMYHENLGVTTEGFWVEAKDLRVGDVFLDATGRLSTLTNIVRVEQAGGVDVFNFTVEGNHNYFILAKEYDYVQASVLVHNSDFCSEIVRVPEQFPPTALSVQEALRQGIQMRQLSLRTVDPSELKGARPWVVGGQTGHPGKHGLKLNNPAHRQVMVDVINNPDHRIIGVYGDSNHAVNIFYKDGTAVITEGGDILRVITAFGTKNKPANLNNFLNRFASHY